MHKAEQFEALEEVHEALTETIKQVANEPSVGLYFVQQHVHKAVPALISLKGQLLDATVDAELSTADMKDALSSVRIMKECGPSVVEQMIRTLNSAGSMMPALHQYRGSSPHLLPTASLSKGRWRSASYRGDLNSDTSRNRQLSSSGMSEKGTLSGDMSKYQFASTSVHPLDTGRTEKFEGFADGITDASKPASFISDCQDGIQVIRDSSSSQFDNSLSAAPEVSIADADNVSDSYMKSVLKSAMLKAGNLGWVSNTSSEVPELSHESKDGDVGSIRSSSTGALKDVSGGNPARYMRAVLDSALSKAETVSREGAKFLRGDIDNQTSETKVAEKKSWLHLSSQGVFGFSRKNQRIENEAEETSPVEEQISVEGFDLEDNFEQFKAERVANLEAWLNESDGADVSNFQGLTATNRSME